MSTSTTSTTVPPLKLKFKIKSSTPTTPTTSSPPPATTILTPTTPTTSISPKSTSSPPSTTPTTSPPPPTTTILTPTTPTTPTTTSSSRHHYTEKIENYYHTSENVYHLNNRNNLNNPQLMTTTMIKQPPTIKTEWIINYPKQLQFSSPTLSSPLNYNYPPLNNEKNQFQLIINVEDFRPDDINISTKDNLLLIDCCFNSDSDNCDETKGYYLSKQLNYKYRLPKFINKNKMTCIFKNFNDNNRMNQSKHQQQYLIIEAPIEKPINIRTIPIKILNENNNLRNDQNINQNDNYKNGHNGNLDGHNDDNNGKENGHNNNDNDDKRKNYKLSSSSKLSSKK